MLNIFTNYVSNKVITVDDKDPPWMTDFIKSKFEWRNTLKELNFAGIKYRNFHVF